VNKPCVILAWLVFAIHGVSRSAEVAPPLHSFPAIQADALGQRLQSYMIWAGPEANGDGVAVAFRKTFQLAGKPDRAEFSIFADARYILWVNGQYVERGPVRFQHNGPEYDHLSIAPQLQAGSNVLALLVVGNLSGGKVMRHRPGLAAMLEKDGREILRTDPTWQYTLENRYRKVAASWADIVDEQVDARWKTVTGPPRLTMPADGTRPRPLMAKRGGH